DRGLARFQALDLPDQATQAALEPPDGGGVLALLGVEARVAAEAEGLDGLLECAGPGGAQAGPGGGRERNPHGNQERGRPRPPLRRGGGGWLGGQRHGRWPRESIHQSITLNTLPIR